MSSSELFTKKKSGDATKSQILIEQLVCGHLYHFVCCISHHDDEYSTNLSKHFTLRLSKKLGSL